jgi:solute carrier family 40 (iron-regulated transporter), member 1
VYKMEPALRRDRDRNLQQQEEAQADRRSEEQHSRLRNFTYNVLPISSLPFYFNHPAFFPSFSLSLLYLTVLSFSGQMITYLISVGYTSLYVGLARAVSTVFELSATWIAPRLMKRIGMVRGGIWSLSWQMIWLAAGIGWYFGDFHGMGTNSVMSATGLAVGVALSRVGLWGYDLCAQNIVQDVSISSRVQHSLYLSSLAVVCAFKLSDPSSRKSRWNIAAPSQQSRLHSRTSLS